MTAVRDGAALPVEDMAEEPGEVRPGAMPDPAFERMLLLLGRLNYMWTNTESLLIHLIAGLARMDKESATLVFLTLGSSTARLSLVQRLAKMDRVEPDCRADVLATCRGLSAVLKLRNRYNHCIYAFDRDGSASTILMRVQDRTDTIRVGQRRAVDEASLTAIVEALTRLRAVNAGIWSLVERHDFPR